MKKILFILLIATGLVACENQEIEFTDYDYTAVYFPIQYPVRTLSLGNDRFDNSLDKELKFHIGISIGGMYENKKNWTVDYILDESLSEGLGNDVKALPDEYYTLTPLNTVTIPSGSFSGLIQVQLTEEFLLDPLALGNHYIIPLRITDTNADSILIGFPEVETPDKRIAADWDANIPPRDFTLFMIKYINEYHGNYLRRGADYTLDALGNITDTVIYRSKYVETDQLVNLNTSNRWTDITNFTGNNLGSQYGLVLTVDQASGNIVVKSSPGSPFQLTEDGTGKFIPEGDSWGGINRDVIYLNYKYSVGVTTHHVFDTLVFRDRGIKYEEFVPLVL